MSYFLDRLQFFKRDPQPFADGHGFSKSEGRDWENSYRARWHWLSWAGCTLYAATDEIHQLFVAGRTGKWQDVLLDSSGALAGLLLAMFMLWLIRRRRAKKQST